MTDPKILSIPFEIEFLRTQQTNKNINERFIALPFFWFRRGEMEDFHPRGDRHRETPRDSSSRRARETSRWSSTRRSRGERERRGWIKIDEEAERRAGETRRDHRRLITRRRPRGEQERRGHHRRLITEQSRRRGEIDFVEGEREREAEWTTRVQ